MIPSVISGWPNSAVSEATIRSQISASSQPPPSAQPETAAIIGVRHSASRRQNAGRRVKERLVELALGERADVGAGGEDLVGAGDHDAADLGVGVEALDRAGELLHQLGRERVARLGAVQAAERDVVVDRRLDQRRHAQPSGGTIALIPVASRPMISFWICEVPS